MSCLSRSQKSIGSQLSISYSNVSCVQIVYCAFIAITSSTSGGAILITSSASLNLDRSHFLSCAATASSCSGGCLYASNLSSCTVSRCCAQSCYATSLGMALYCYMFQNSSCLIDLFTMVACSPNQQGSYSIIFYYGSNCITNLNSTNCRLLNVVSSFYSTAYYSLTSSYGTYVGAYGSIVTEYNSQISGSTSLSNLSSTNFINNTQISSSYGLIYALSTVDVTNSIFYGNYFSYTFTTNTGGSVYVINCTFSSTPSLSGSVSTSGIIILASPTTLSASYNVLAKCMANSTLTMSSESHTSLQAIYYSCIALEVALLI